MSDYPFRFYWPVPDTFDVLLSFDVLFQRDVKPAERQPLAEAYRRAIDGAAVEHQRWLWRDRCLLIENVNKVGTSPDESEEFGAVMQRALQQMHEVCPIEEVSCLANHEGEPSHEWHLWSIEQQSEASSFEYTDMKPDQAAEKILSGPAPAAG